MTTTRSTAESTKAVTPVQAHRPWQQGVLPEVLAYLGAAFVVGAGFALVIQSWETWNSATQISIVAAAMVSVYVAAAALSLSSGGRGGLAQHGTRRRLVTVLATLAAPLAALLTGLAIDAADFRVERREDLMMMIVFSVALLAAAFAAWWVPGAFPTVAVGLAGFMWITAFDGTVIGPLESPLLSEVVLLVAAIGWLVIAPFLLRPRILAESLGMAGFIILQMPAAFSGFDLPRGIDEGVQTQITLAAWTARIALLVFAVVALALFTRGRSWAWAAGGVVAAGVGAMSIAGQALGLIAGLFVAGVVLLAASGVIIITRGRRAAPGPLSDPGPTSDPGR